MTLAAHTTISRLKPVGAKRAFMLALGAGLLAALGALLFPPAAFSIDEALYIDMADAAASRGALDITPQNLPEGAPVMTKSAGMVPVIDGRVTPQYPGLYGFIAAPFFFLFGIKGLALLNALSGVACVWLTYLLAHRLETDEWTARIATFLLAFASIFAGYAFAVWPHMLALAFILAGALATAVAGYENNRISRRAALIAGLCIGAGIGVRVDVMLAAIAAFFWLRLFARPEDRLTSLALVAGMAPGLIISALINGAKFGSFNPFSYGASGGATALSLYLPILLPAGIAAAAVLAIDVSAPPVRRAIDRFRALPPALFLVLAFGAVIGVSAIFPRLFYGLYILLVDAQAFAGPPRPGLERTVYGYWDFWGMPKKALLQSMPWLALIIAPIAAFLHGERAKQSSFLLLFAAAPIMFFALNAWYGGMSYNMRYYLPAAPFLAILAAISLARFRAEFQKNERLFIFSIAGGVMLALGAYVMAPIYGPGLETPLQLYPQLLLAAAIVSAILFNLLRPEQKLLPAIIAGLSGAAIANAAMISLFDVNGYLSHRAQHVPFGKAYAAAAPAGSVMFTNFDELLVNASLNGAAIIRLDNATRADVDATVAAYHDANRCVFVHTYKAAQMFGEEKLFRINLSVTEAAPGLALYVHRESSAHCRTTP